MHANEITHWGLLAAFVTVPAALLLLRVAKVRLGKELMISMVRMTVQLVLVGFYLTVIFKINSPFLNLGYILLMVAAANFSLLRHSGLKLSFFKYTFPALLIALSVVLLYFIFFVYQPKPLFDARYVIPIAGMLLGNSMNRTIVMLERFYSAVREDCDGYSSYVAMGATVREAAAPFVATAYRAGISPALATYATMGIVSLPGMMTGQILGGSSPLLAIEYQITILLAIFVATELASLLAIFFSMHHGFNRLGYLRDDVFKRA